VNVSYKFDPCGKVAKIIKTWEPKDCKTEKDYEQSLLIELKKNLAGIKIQSQYGSGSQRVDIVVDDKIPIELKKDLRTSSVLHITIGQLERYLQKWETIFLVLCGSISSENLQSLSDYAEGKQSLLTTYDDSVIIIDKTLK
jgi:hypothetical protein